MDFMVFKFTNSNYLAHITLMLRNHLSRLSELMVLYIILMFLNMCSALCSPEL